MSANIPVDFEELKKHHPNSRQIGGMIGGLLQTRMTKEKWETCTVQISYALNKAGAPVLNYAYPDRRVATGKVRGTKDDSGDNYIYSVLDMKVYLDKTYGEADNYKGTVAQMKAAIKGRKGIIAFGYRHMDLWEGDQWHYQSLYLDLWEFAEVKKWGIFFWEVSNRSEAAPATP
jgi:Type VI secretion system (T6SS), amidase effector protein 4